MRSPEVMYLEDVLGIEGYIRPATVAADLSHGDGEVSLRKAVVALSDVPLINGRPELLKKMMASIQIHDFIAIDCTRDESHKLEGIEPTAIVLLGQNIPQLIESWPQSEWLLQKSKQTTLPSLEDLTDTTDAARLQRTKKQAWALLQSFQKEL